MNHPATFVLSLAAGRALDVLHSCMEIGELGAISQDAIARIGHISEGTVSRIMHELVIHKFIEREKDPTMNGGHGGYWIRLLALPAREGSAFDPLPDGSAIDPLPEAGKSPVPMLPIPDSTPGGARDQLLIPTPPVMVHDSLSQEEEESRAPAVVIATTPLYRRLMAEPRMDRDLARAIAQRPPGTVGDFDADLRVAQTFAKTPFWFTVGKWKKQQRVIAPEVCHERPNRSVQPSHAPDQRLPSERIRERPILPPGLKVAGRKAPPVGD